jgi:hypothetical protein
MTKTEAANRLIYGDQIFIIEEAVREKIKEFILSQSGFYPELSEEWVRKKRNDWHYIYTGQTVDNLRVEFVDDPASPHDFIVTGYSEGFKYASHQYIESKGQTRSFLPSGEAAFDENSEATEEFCEWLLDLILEAMVENLSG